jgi:hypothetical protein
MGQMVSFDSLLWSEHTNGFGIFRKFPLAVSVTGRAIIMRINFMGSE